MDVIRDRCRRRGWNLGELARRAGLSRTTVYQLERGKTRPHAQTVTKLATALQMSPEKLWECLDCREPLETSRHWKHSGTTDDRPGQFDRITNPAVGEVHRQSPGLFAGWSQGEWDELYSTFGTGGPLTREGVVDAAAKINRKRETVQQLHIILETHLADVASHLVETLYRMARTHPQSIVPPEPFDDGADSGGRKSASSLAADE